jgi:serine/threonine protein kinase
LENQKQISCREGCSDDDKKEAHGNDAKVLLYIRNMRKGLEGDLHIIEALKYIPKSRSPTATSIITPMYDYDLRSWRSHQFQHNKVVDEDQIWMIAFALGSAFSFLHEGVSVDDRKRVLNWVPILHLYIKPDNILVRIDFNWKLGKQCVRVVVSDFGMSLLENHGYNPNWQGGAYNYQGPEKTQKLTTKATDIYGIGECVYFACCGEDSVDYLTERRDEQENH